MTLFITSSPYVEDADRPLLWEDNDFIENLRQALPENPRALFVCADPDDHGNTCRFGADTVTAFANDDNEAAKAIEPLEETIDDMIMMLKDRHTKRLKNGQCSIGSGLVFMEALTYFERASDQCSSIAVMMLARNNEQILQNHYDYLREIHAGNDVAYLAERERRREQYIKPLKEIM